MRKRECVYGGGWVFDESAAVHVHVRGALRRHQNTQGLPPRARMRGKGDISERNDPQDEPVELAINALEDLRLFSIPQRLEILHGSCDRLRLPVISSVVMSGP